MDPRISKDVLEMFTEMQLKDLLRLGVREKHKSVHEFFGGRVEGNSEIIPLAPGLLLGCTRKLHE
jgi:hypothetical protein